MQIIKIMCRSCHTEGCAECDYTGFEYANVGESSKEKVKTMRKDHIRSIANEIDAAILGDQ